MALLGSVALVVTANSLPRVCQTCRGTVDGVLWCNKYRVAGQVPGPGAPASLESVVVTTTRGGLTGSMLDGRYRIGSVIARGGMSTVYRALDTRLDRAVAVKVMATQYAADPAFLSRFSREAKLAAGLDHPGIVAVYDHGRDGDHVFLVMELVDGGTLRELIHQRGPLPVPVTTAVLGQLLDALSAAHASGLVHRDVKPENVLISARGRVKVADFGLVRAVTSNSMATGDVILGTVAYLSPEQVDTGASDTRSDVYSAGIVAWEMLAGRPPFVGENAMSVAYQHVHSEVPYIGDEVPGIAAPLEDLLADATQRRPEHRPKDAVAFGNRLGVVVRQLRIPPVPVPVPTKPEPQPAGRIAGASRPVDRRQGRPQQRAATSVAPQRPGVAEPVPAGSSTRVQVADRPMTAMAPRYQRPEKMISARRRNWTRRIVAIVVLMLLAVAAAMGGWWLGDGRWSYTPRLAGMSQADAVLAAQQAGLAPKVATVNSTTVAAGEVTSIEPDPGTKLPRGAEVTIVVSLGAQLVGVPAVAGKTPEDGRNAVLAAGFTIGDRVYRFDRSRPDGTLLGTEPAAGAKAPKGSAVGLVVNRSLQLPDVRGRSVEAARKALQQAGFRVRVGEPRFTDGVPAPDVAETTPVAGSRLDPAAADVTLHPSNAVTVPDVSNGDLTAAKNTLTALGLNYRVSGLFTWGSKGVSSQQPEPGSLVEPGGTVRLSTW